MPDELLGPWDELGLSVLYEFFNDLHDEEPYYWEAKGEGQWPKGHAICKEVAAFANGDGGYLIIGVDEHKDSTGRVCWDVLPRHPNSDVDVTPQA